MNNLLQWEATVRVIAMTHIEMKRFRDKVTYVWMSRGLFQQSLHCYVHFLTPLYSANLQHFKSTAFVKLNRVFGRNKWLRLKWGIFVVGKWTNNIRLLFRNFKHWKIWRCTVQTIICIIIARVTSLGANPFKSSFATFQKVEKLKCSECRV